MPFFRPTESQETVAEFRVNGQLAASYSAVEYPAPMTATPMRSRPLNQDFLIGPKAKLERAREHLADVISLWRKYCETLPFADGQSFNSDGVEVIWISVSQPPPRQIGVVVGDAVHNLRSALDCLACDLVRANGLQPKPNTGFPTSDAAIQAILPLVGSFAAAFFKRIRRATRWREALWELHRLNIQDKHSQILTTCAATMQVETTVGMPFMSISPNGTLAFGTSPPDSIPFPGTKGRLRGLLPVTLNGGQNEIYRFNPSVQENVSFSVSLVFPPGPAEGEPVINMLEMFAHGVERVLVLAERHVLNKGSTSV